MNTDPEPDGDGSLAPAVRSILDATVDRERPSGRVEADARDLRAALATAERERRVPVVAEVKPTSPTTEGEHGGDPAALAAAMVDGGAAAVSVLTEPERFGGSTAALRRVRERVDVPVLRKDFLLCERQLDAVESDAVLLIARFLGGRAGVGADPLDRMVDAARDRGLRPLVEVHDRSELERAVDAGADLIGVNNRDLARLEVDLATFERVAPAAPEGATLLAESGIATPNDAARMRRAGADGLLIGTAIMDGDPRANARRLTTPAGDESGRNPGSERRP